MICDVSVRKPVFGVSNQVRHKSKILDLRKRGIKLCSENKGDDKLCSYCTADLRLCLCICVKLVNSSPLFYNFHSVLAQTFDKS